MKEGRLGSLCNYRDGTTHICKGCFGSLCNYRDGIPNICTEMLQRTYVHIYICTYVLHIHVMCQASLLKER